jgi:hypothetical protein
MNSIAREFTHAGLQCRVVLTSLGHHCGYVAVPPDHPWFGLDYTDEVPVPQEVIEREINIEEIGIINLFCTDEPTTDACPIVLAVDVHGGLTFANKFNDADLWWFGFDCAHAGDGRNSSEPGWRDQSYAETHCRKLAEQLARFANGR